eukprot:scaffold91_cov254-Pinguiococcus_pyrenoidosus.AAC.20
MGAAGLGPTRAPFPVGCEAASGASHAASGFEFASSGESSGRCPEAVGRNRPARSSARSPLPQRPHREASAEGTSASSLFWTQDVPCIELSLGLLEAFEACWRLPNDQTEPSRSPQAHAGSRRGPTPLHSSSPHSLEGGPPPAPPPDGRHLPETPLLLRRRRLA